jgi:tetratricopeptide (TPR) repeat protein
MSRSICRRALLWSFVAVSVLGTSGSARGQAGGALEITSGLGRKLYALPDDDAVKAASKALTADPKNISLVLALSKAQAGRRQYKEAVVTDTAGLAREPKNTDLLLERGHRELGLREFAAARKDLELAVKLKPDMADAYYHLGLSHYFVGEFGEAAAAFMRARDLRDPKDMDNVVDDTNWLYASLRRAGKTDEAAKTLTRVPPEYTATGHPAIYLRLVRLYQGAMSPMAAQAPKPKGPDDVEGELSYNTTSYGVGNWHLFQGHDQARADLIFRGVVENEAWNSWGFIGSEVELVRGKK